jgi:hypothetical protein
MSMHESRAKIGAAIRDLRTNWSNTKVYWTDSNSEHFQEEFLEPMEMDVRVAVVAMDQMATLLSSIRRQCE